MLNFYERINHLSATHINEASKPTSLRRLCAYILMIVIQEVLVF
jgi:hypothetical protein